MADFARAADATDPADAADLADTAGAADIAEEADPAHRADAATSAATGRRPADAAGDGPPAHPLPKALKRPAGTISRRVVGNRPTAPSTPDAPARDGIVDCGLYVDGVRQPGKWHYADALRAARAHENGFVWLGLKEPDQAPLARIADILQLHELAVEDALNSTQRPKVERYPDMTFVAMRTARYVAHHELTEHSEVVETGNIMMFVGRHFIITVRHGEACPLSPVRKQLDARPDLLRQGPWAVAYAVYDLVVDELLDISVSFDEDISTLEEQVFSRYGHGRIQHIYQLKRELMEFKRAVIPLQRPVAGLVTGQVTDVPAEIRHYFRDVNDHLNRVVEQVMYFDDVLNSILAARLAQVTVNQNNDMRKIAAWAGIAAVWTAIAGVYGMNFQFMPELDWPYGYPAAVGLMVVVSLLLYRAFRRSGWL